MGTGYFPGVKQPVRDADYPSTFNKEVVDGLKLYLCQPPGMPWDDAHSYDMCKQNYTVFVGPCHHCMARPQAEDGGTASDMEGGCE